MIRNNRQSLVRPGGLLTQSAADQINRNINQSQQTTSTYQPSARFGETAMVKITSVDALGKYSGTIISGHITETDNTADLDIAGLSETEEGDAVFVWNLAEDVSGVSATNVLAIDATVPAIFIGVSDANGVPVLATFAGGGGGIDPPTEQGQILQATAANTYGWQWPVLHAAT